MEIKLGSNLRFLRKKKGRNQHYIAELMQKGHTTIGNWENGIAEPNLSELTKLSNFYEISVQDLIYKDLANESLIQKSPTIKKREIESLSESLSESLIEENQVNSANVKKATVQEVIDLLTLNPAPKPVEKGEEKATLVPILKELIEAKENIIVLLTAKNKDQQKRIAELEELLSITHVKTSK